MPPYKKREYKKFETPNPNRGFEIDPEKLKWLTDFQVPATTELYRLQKIGKAELPTENPVEPNLNYQNEADTGENESESDSEMLPSMPIQSARNKVEEWLNGNQFDILEDETENTGTGMPNGQQVENIYQEQQLRQEEESESESGEENLDLPLKLPEEFQDILDDIRHRDKLIYKLTMIYNSNGCSQAILERTIDAVNTAAKKAVVPKTVEAFLNHLDDLVPPPSITKHYFCTTCEKYIGSEMDVASDRCDVCPPGASNMATFFELDLKQQIKNLFESGYITESSLLSPKFNSTGMIESQLDGSECRRIYSLRPKQKYDLTLVLNTDGLRLTNSGGEAWPIFLGIAELKDRLRYSNILTAGLWYHEKKPNMNAYLKPFVNQMIKCYSEGINWINPKTKGNENTRLVLLDVVADGPARANVQNITHHGGFYSCHRCETVAGKTYHYYELERERTHESIMEYAAVAERLRALETTKINKDKIRVYGVRGRSALADIPCIDLSKVFIPEAQHLVFYGSTEQLYEEILINVNIWNQNILDNIEKIDDFLKSIKVPSFIHRPPKPTKDHDSFKSSQYMFWLFFWSLVSVSEYMDKKYLDHFILYVHAIYLLCKDKISESDLQEANICLVAFVRDAEDLYGPRFMTYNVHHLVHLPASVREFGSLRLTWTFPYEDLNGVLDDKLHGTKNFCQEMANRLRVMQKIPMLRLKLAMEEKRKRIIVLKKDTVQGYFFDDSEKMELCRCDLDPSRITIYKKLHYWNIKFTTQLWKKTTEIKNNDYTVEIFIKNYQPRIVGKIRYFLKDEENYFVMLDLFKLDKDRAFKNEERNIIVSHLLPVQMANRIVLLNMENILQMRHVVPVGDFVALQPYNMKKNL